MKSALAVPVSFAIEIICTYGNLRKISRIERSALQNQSHLSEKIKKLESYIDKYLEELTAKEKSFVFRTLLFLYVKRDHDLKRAQDILDHICDEFNADRLRRNFL